MTDELKKNQKKTAWILKEKYLQEMEKSLYNALKYSYCCSFKYLVKCTATIFKGGVR